MNRVQYMTLGLVLAFVGTQLCFIDTYVLTPQATKIIKQAADKTAAQGFESADPGFDQSQDYDRPFRQANYSASGSTDQWKPRKKITHPRWIRWPIFFLGAVFFLHGIAVPASNSESS